MLNQFWDFEIFFFRELRRNLQVSPSSNISLHLTINEL